VLPTIFFFFWLSSLAAVAALNQETRSAIAVLLAKKAHEKSNYFFTRLKHSKA
jgi:hypothetical protein